MALDQAVRSGRALYVGISSYSAAKTREAARIARELGTPLLIHQPSYNMFNRWVENMVFTDDVLAAIDQHAVESGVNLWAKQTKD